MGVFAYLAICVCMYMHIHITYTFVYIYKMKEKEAMLKDSKKDMWKGLEEGSKGKEGNEIMIL